MNELAKRDTEMARLETLDTEQLRAELAESLTLTAAQLVRMAAIVRILEDRGEDLSDLRMGLIGYLRRIAHGQLLPEVVVRFSAYPALIRRVGQLPLPDQRKLADGAPVPLVVARGDASDVRLVDPSHLSRDQVTQVFAADHLRTEAEQIVIIERKRSDATAKPLQRGRVRADRERNGLVVGRAFAPLADVLSALASLADADYDESLNEGDATAVLALKLTPAQHTQLKVRAAKSGANMTTLAMRALAAAGLFRREDA